MSTQVAFFINLYFTKRAHHKNVTNTFTTQKFSMCLKVIVSLVFLDLILTVLTLKQAPHLENFDTELPTHLWKKPKNKS